MMQSITEDGWVSELARPFDQSIQGTFIFFMLFELFGTFGVLNLLTALFVDTLMEVHEEEREADQTRKRKNKMGNIDKIEDLFNSLDKDQSKSLSKEELLGAMETLKQERWDQVWEEMEISPKVFNDFLQYYASGALDDSDDEDDGDDDDRELQYDKFLDKLASMDFENVRSDQWRLHSEVSKLKQMLSKITEGLAVLAGSDVERERMPDVLWTKPTKQAADGTAAWNRRSLAIMRSMSIQRVAEWLMKKEKLKPYAQRFVNHHISGWALPHLSDEDLQETFGMNTLGARKSFHLALEDLRMICEQVAQEEQVQKADEKDIR